MAACMENPVSLAVQEAADARKSELRDGIRLASGVSHAQLRRDQEGVAEALLTSPGAVIVTARTGAGKTTVMLSACFAATIDSGTIAAVVSPTRGLVLSLAKTLKKAREKSRVFFFCSDLNASVELEGLERQLCGGSSGAIVVTTPDQLVFFPRLARTLSNGDIRLFVCDEAHLLEPHSQFREAVRLLPAFYASLGNMYGGRPLLRLMSGTLSEARAAAAAAMMNVAVSHEMVSRVDIRRAKCPWRRNISLNIEQRMDVMAFNRNGEEEQHGRSKILAAEIAKTARGLEKASSVVFVNTKSEATQLKAKIRRHLTDLGVHLMLYTITSDTEEETRANVVGALVDAESAPVVAICTELLGMGVDTGAVGFVAHVEIPNSIERLVQELGRTNHAGLLSGAKYLLLSAPDAEKAKWLNRILKFSPLRHSHKSAQAAPNGFCMTLEVPWYGEPCPVLLHGESSLRDLAALYERLVIACRRVAKALKGPVQGSMRHGRCLVSALDGRGIHDGAHALRNCVGTNKASQLSFSAKADAVRLSVSLLADFPAMVHVRPCSIDVSTEFEKAEMSILEASYDDDDLLFDHLKPEKAALIVDSETCPSIIRAAEVYAKMSIVSSWRARVTKRAEKGSTNLSPTQRIYGRLETASIIDFLLQNDSLQCSEREATETAEKILYSFMPSRESPQYLNASRSIRREWIFTVPEWLGDVVITNPVFRPSVRASQIARDFAFAAVKQLHCQEVTSINNVIQTSRFASKWLEGNCPITMIDNVFGGEAETDLAYCQNRICRCAEGKCHIR